MAFTPFNGAGGGGSGSEDCTASTAQWRNGYTAIGVGTDDEPANGDILDYSGVTSITPSTVAQSFSTSGKYLTSNLTVNAIPNQKSDSGNVALSSGDLSKSYAAGWYNNAHGAVINTQTKSATPSVNAQTIYADSNYVMTGFTVNAIPNQMVGAAVTLDTSTTSASRPAGTYLTSDFTVSISPQSKSVTPSTSAQTVYPDSGRVLSSVSVGAIATQAKSTTPSTSAQTITPDSGKYLSSVSVGAIPNQTDGGTVKLTSSTTYSNFSRGQWCLSDHYVYVDVYDGSVS